MAETKRVAMLMTLIMIVMAMGNLLVEAEDDPDSKFIKCYPPCLVDCKKESTFPKVMFCPVTCLKKCLLPAIAPSPSDSSEPLFNKINYIHKTDDFCKFGCAVNHCAYLSSPENPNVEKVASCVDSCSSKCSS